MSESLMEAAYRLARQHDRAARLAVSSDLNSQFCDAGFEAIHYTTERAILLHREAVAIARRIHEEKFPYEKGEKILCAQFEDFPVTTCRHALYEAYSDLR